MKVDRRVLAAAALVVVVAVAGVLALGAPHRDVAASAPASAPATAAPAEAPTFADFVGAETCGQCHARQYAAWKGSTHGRAGGPPTRNRVIAPFDGSPITFKDAVVTPSVTARGEYVFTVAQKDRPSRIYRVDAVVGGGFMAGGGTQAFFSKFPDGTLRFLPFDYSKPLGRWLCNTGGRTNRGWVPITPAMAVADCADWTPNRVLGGSDRFRGCDQCHGSQIELAFDPTAHRYQTRFTTLAINCESCHGPGRRHVDLARSGRISAEVDIGMRPLSTLTKQESVAVCFQCHAMKATLEWGYLPGRRPDEHFALRLPEIVDTLYFPDGRTRTFAYQEGHLSSDCYLNGSMTCVDCHEPHSQRYRDVNGSPLPGRLDNGQCLGCHPSKAQPVERHTHHQAASPGSRCVSCHMPYLQEADVGARIPYARSDHTIPIPRPSWDAQLGVESACQRCHRNQTPEGLQAQVTRWYGELKPHPPPVTAALEAGKMADPRSAARRILTATGEHPLAELVGLAGVLRRSERPDASTFDQAATDELERRAKNTDPDRQALALAMLHLDRGAEPEVRGFLSDRLRALGPRDSAVRHRWAWILTVRGDSYLGAGDAPSAITAYERANDVRPGHPGIVRALGLAYMVSGDYDKAAEQFRRSLELNPDQAQVLVELGAVLMQRGNADGATQAFRRAVEVSPQDPLGYANLGVILLQRGEVKSSIEALEKAVALDPSLANANFMLGNAYAALGRLPQAADALARGLEFAPGDAAARRMLDELRRRSRSGRD
jgi:tetratricopeptide (TPR) repeat protein